MLVVAPADPLPEGVPGFTYPATYESVLAVERARRRGGAGRGGTGTSPVVDLVAPGEGVVGPLPGGGHTVAITGTLPAAAYVAGHGRAGPRCVPGSHAGGGAPPARGDGGPPGSAGAGPGRRLGRGQPGASRSSAEVATDAARTGDRPDGRGRRAAAAAAAGPDDRAARVVVRARRCARRGRSAGRRQGGAQRAGSRLAPRARSARAPIPAPIARARQAQPTRQRDIRPRAAPRKFPGGAQAVRRSRTGMLSAAVVECGTVRSGGNR